ncbi:hypothetical protein F2P79_023563 [Pimephales promelas]|nr:hypothetical protein F2P79_023563 [Pimephales promelas]
MTRLHLMPPENIKDGIVRDGDKDERKLEEEVQHRFSRLEEEKKRTLRKGTPQILSSGRRKEYIKKRYSTDTLFQRRNKQYMMRRYAGDPEFRAHHILRCTLRKTQITFFIDCNAHCGSKIKINLTSVPARKDPSLWLAKRWKVPYMHSGVRFSKALHMSARSATEPCFLVKSSASSGSCVVPEERKQEWICPTCDQHLMRGQMCSIAAANKLELPPIPADVSEMQTEANAA